MVLNQDSDSDESFKENITQCGVNASVISSSTASIPEGAGGGGFPNIAAAPSGEIVDTPIEGAAAQDSRVSAAGVGAGVLGMLLGGPIIALLAGGYALYVAGRPESGAAGCLHDDN